ncbi:hypothetical protein OTU49_013793, partial [Cherax quadricarinatus]
AEMDDDTFIDSSYHSKRNKRQARSRLNPPAQPQGSLKKSTTGSATGRVQFSWPFCIRQPSIAILKTLVKKPKMEGSLHKFPVDGPRKIIVARHGERVDFTFGDWTRFCFDETRKYQQCDLNMPETLPQRKGAPRSFYKDGPLTNIGVFQATLVGQALKANNTEVHHVFCSPALRCVQTCASILKGMGIDEVMPINIEPGLFEFLPWYKDEIPTCR